MVGVRELIAKLKDKDEDTRSKAAKALGKVGGKLAVFLLIRALRDKWWVTRCNAADSLAGIGDKSAVPALIKALDDGDYLVQASASAALAKLNAKRALPRLKKLSESYLPWLNSGHFADSEKKEAVERIKSAIKALSKSS